MGEPATAEGHVEVPGGRIWYRIIGTDRPGIPVLCLHGGLGMPHDYLEPLADLASGRPVIFYDQLGCGRSDCWPAASREQPAGAAASRGQAAARSTVIMVTESHRGFGR